MMTCAVATGCAGGVEKSAQRFADAVSRMMRPAEDAPDDPRYILYNRMRITCTGEYGDLEVVAMGCESIKTSCYVLPAGSPMYVSKTAGGWLLRPVDNNRRYLLKKDRVPGLDEDEELAALFSSSPISSDPCDREVGESPRGKGKRSVRNKS